MKDEKTKGWWEYKSETLEKLITELKEQLNANWRKDNFNQNSK